MADPTTVTIPGIGDVDFPATMSNADIHSAVQHLVLDHANKTPLKETTDPNAAFSQSLRKTIGDTGKGILKGFNPIRQLSQGIASKEAGDKQTIQDIEHPESASHDFGMGKTKSFLKGLSDPAQGGEVIGQLASGGIAGRVAPHVPRALSAAGGAIDAVGKAARPASFPLGMVEGLTSGSPMKGVAVAAAPYAIQGVGKGMKAIGDVLSPAKTPPPVTVEPPRSMPPLVEKVGPREMPHLTPQPPEVPRNMPALTEGSGPRQMPSLTLQEEMRRQMPPLAETSSSVPREMGKLTPDAPAGRLTGKKATTLSEELTNSLEEVRRSPADSRMNSMPPEQGITPGGSTKQSGKFKKSDSLGQAGGFTSGRPATMGDVPPNVDGLLEKLGGRAPAAGPKEAASSLGGARGAATENALIDTSKTTPAEWLELRRYYGSKRLSQLTGKTPAEIKILAPGPSRVPLEVEQRIEEAARKNRY